MMTNRINKAEMFLLIAFLLCYFFFQAIPVHWRWIVIVIYFLLGALYFPMGFYTLRSPKFKTIYSVFFGILFSITLTAIFFCLLKSALAVILLWLMIAIYFIVAIIQAISFYIFSKTEGQIIMYDLGITIRYLIFLCLMIFAAVTFNYRQ
jgi:hypothetical protein